MLPLNLRLVEKFHTRKISCAGSIDENQAKTLAFVNVAMFVLQGFFFAYPTATAVMFLIQMSFLRRAKTNVGSIWTP